MPCVCQKVGCKTWVAQSGMECLAHFRKSLEGLNAVEIKEAKRVRKIFNSHRANQARAAAAASKRSGEALTEAQVEILRKRKENNAKSTQYP